MTPTKLLERKLTSILDRSIDLSIATSCSLSISHGREDGPALTVHRGHGTNDQSVYDLASLTKILGTTLALAHAIARGRLTLHDQPFSCWQHATIRALLAHKAGLPEHRRFYDLFKLSDKHFEQNRETIFAELFATKANELRDARLYSDLGFMALGFLLENKIGKPLNEIFDDAWHRCGFCSTFSWFPSRPVGYQAEHQRVIPTGFCRARKAHVLAQVHDPCCYYLGGLAGHAGLFGTLGEVDACGRYFLRAHQQPRTEIDHLLRLFSLRGLGFDKPTTRGTTRYFSPFAFGHFGYTGTSLWIDPRAQNGKGRVITLLTNRVHCSDSPEGIFWLRLAINRALSGHDA